MKSLALQSSTNAATKTTILGEWTFCSRAPGAISNPEQLDDTDADWIVASAPGTVAGALANAGQWDMNRPPSIDEFDWWYRTRFNVSDDLASQLCRLCFDGLATLAEVWLNGEQLLVAENMFCAYQIDVSHRLHSQNTLEIGFRSITSDVQKKRPRPRWKTNLVSHQQLRWHRTSLLGRMPGWSPPVPAIGPWRSVRLESGTALLSELQLRTSLDATTGVVSFKARLESVSEIDRATLRVGTLESELSVKRTENGLTLSGELRWDDVPLWWPHTHGDQPLTECRVELETGSERIGIDCGRIGFRTLRVESLDEFSIELNGQPIYCRGACWTVSDVFDPNGNEATLRRDLTLVRDSGANMLRVIGTMVYESDTFYRLCDELGLLVWQDFMFANMDYPVDDAAFSRNITAEATQRLCRLSPHPCVVVYCGSSEIEQQAAMLGVRRDLWRNEWFGDQLPRLCEALHPGTVYVPSSPSGGVLPFHPSSGISHYYGIGAYRRSLLELRQADVRFTSECLGFANLPEPEMVNTITGGMTPVVHHPVWKQRVPRDTGAGWDFEDVRDFYFQSLYGLDPVTVRSSDTHRYLDLSRIVPGEMMAKTFSEWRSSHSRNRGGLVWFFKDLWPAAGWGIVDSSGIPKAAYYSLKRTWQDRQLTMTDEGLNGLHLHIINERSDELAGFVEVTLLKEPNVVVARKEVQINVSGRGQQLLNADEILGGFYDTSYAYRFGPPQHDVVSATLFDINREVVSEAFHLIRRPVSMIGAAKVEIFAEWTDETECRVTIRSERFLYGVRLSASGFQPDDNYFHLLPDRTKTVRCKRLSNSALFRGELEALNLDSSISIPTPGKRSGP